MITKEAILQRKQELAVEQERVAQAFFALNGAIQTCDWFLAQLEAEGEDDSPSDSL